MKLKWITNQETKPDWLPKDTKIIKGEPMGSESMTSAEIKAQGLFGWYIEVPDDPQEFTAEAAYHALTGEWD
jgi:hypothetical protein